MRHLAMVLNEICYKITDNSGSNLLELKKKLIEIRDSVMYSAPECLVEEWELSGYWINSFINKEYSELTETEKIIVDIWMNKI